MFKSDFSSRSKKISHFVTVMNIMGHVGFEEGNYIMTVEVSSSGGFLHPACECSEFAFGNQLYGCLKCRLFVSGNSLQ